MVVDLVVRGGEVVDGRGGDPFSADVVVDGGRIVELGRFTSEAHTEIDARGLVVAPGFIDIHSHSDYTLLVDPRAVSSIAQGVTLEVLGNCGFGCAPIRNAALAPLAIYGFDGSVPLAWTDLDGYLERLEAARPGVNVLTLVPHGQLRLSVVGIEQRPAAAQELAVEADLLEEGLEAGAFGFSTGLEYPAERGACEDEITALCRIAARRGGLYATHTRYRDAGAIGAIDEALRTAARAEVRLQISHLLPRSGEEDGWRAIELAENARARGLDVAFDMHTRLFGTTLLATLLPPWALRLDGRALADLLADESRRGELKAHDSLIASGGDWDRVVPVQGLSESEVGRSLAEIGRERGRDPHDAALDVLRENLERRDRLMVILRCHTERQQREVFRHPLCVPASDATALAPDGPLAGRSFHGAYTWAAWFYRFMVREHGLLSLPEAVRKLTAQPAQVLGLRDRGVLGPGACADIVAFDPECFAERGTVLEPNRTAQGMQHVVVNGVVTLRDGVVTGMRGGRALRRGAA